MSDDLLLELSGGSGRLARLGDVVMFSPDSDVADIVSVVERASSDRVLAEVQELIVERTFDLPPLLLAIVGSGSIQLMLFGDMTVETTARSAPRLSSAAAGTWIEHRIDRAVAQTISTIDVELVAGCKLGAGVVPAGGMKLTVEPTRPESSRNSLGGEDLTSTGRDAPSALPASGPMVRPPVAPERADPMVEPPAGREQTELPSVEATSRSFEPGMRLSASALLADDPVPDPQIRPDAREEVHDPSDGLDSAEPVPQSEPDHGSNREAIVGPPAASLLEGDVASAATEQRDGTSIFDRPTTPIGPHDRVGHDETTATSSTETEPTAHEAGDPASALQSAFVEGVTCGCGWRGPEATVNCFACSASLAGRPVELFERPPLARLVFSDHPDVVVDRNLSIGRNPAGAGSFVPIALGDADDTVSKHHADIVLDGWRMLLHDRNSTNGVFVRPQHAGETEHRVEAGVPQCLEVGMTFALGATEVQVVRPESPEGEYFGAR